MKDERNLTPKEKKIIVRIASGIITVAMIGYAATVAYKLNKGEKIGNGCFYIVMEEKEDNKTHNR